MPSSSSVSPRQTPVSHSHLVSPVDEAKREDAAQHVKSPVTMQALTQQLHEFLDEDCDLDKDEDVLARLKRKFNIYLPQRKSLYHALIHSNSDHPVIALLIRYREPNKPTDSPWH